MCEFVRQGKATRHALVGIHGLMCVQVPPTCSYASTAKGKQAADVAAAAAAALALGSVAVERNVGAGKADNADWLPQAESLLAYSLQVAPINGAKTEAHAAKTTFGVQFAPCHLHYDLPLTNTQDAIVLLALTITWCTIAPKTQL
jgi:hypothetical protein